MGLQLPHTRSMPNGKSTQAGRLPNVQLPDLDILNTGTICTAMAETLEQCPPREVRHAPKSTNLYSRTAMPVKAQASWETCCTPHKHRMPHFQSRTETKQ